MKKVESQRILFSRADLLFAIGPLLRDALGDLLPSREITTLIPGLDEVAVRPAPRTFTGFMSGRLSADAAKIKQGHLGVAAFADAHKRAHADAGLPDSLKNQPRLILRGADMESIPRLVGQPDATDWRRFAERYADRVVNINALPYTTERNVLLDELTRATVALMPSWHEGFGLVGWEAVAAGVPLVITEKSGLYQLLHEHRNGAWLNWVFAVDIRGRVDEPYFHEEDLKAVSDRLLEIAKDPAAARQKAASLREGASSDFAWRNCVDSALSALHWIGPDVLAPAFPSSTAVPTAKVDIPVEQSKESPLELPEPKWQLGSGLADSQLLRAEEAAVPFDPAREPEINRLISWAYDTEYPQALRLVTGAGGTGKTRLALELCTRLGPDGWHCGFLPAELSSVHAPGAWAVLSTRGEPLLIVVDYAETRQETLIALIRAMMRSTVRPRVRLLLLARDGGEWWERLPTRDAVAESFLSGYTTSGPFALPLLHDRMPQREAAYRAAVRAYGDRLAVNEVPHLAVDLTGEHFGRPLYIQMAALLALHGERPASAEGLTKALLHHERRYWRRLVAETSEPAGLIGIDDQYAVELMALATLAGGFTRSKDAQDTWRAWTSSLGSDLDSRSQRILFDSLAALYPGQHGLQPLRPDLLGEALVAHLLLQNSGPDLLDAFLHSARSSAQRLNALTVVARLSKHRPEIGATVVGNLTRNFIMCVQELISVATQTDSLLPEWIQEAFMKLPVPIRYQAVGLLLPHTTHESVQLAQLACSVSAVDVEKSRRKFSSRPHDIRVRADLARALRDHAVDLVRAGQDGLSAAQESVDIYAKLAPKDPRLESGWALALSNYSSHLSVFGKYSEALHSARDALRIYEKLAKKKSGTS